jgi:hypothetical protein
MFKDNVNLQKCLFMEPQLPQVCCLVDLSIETMFICGHVCPIHSYNIMVFGGSFWYGDNWHNHSLQLPYCPNQLLISIYTIFATIDWNQHSNQYLPKYQGNCVLNKKEQIDLEEVNVYWRENNTHVICHKFCQLGRLTFIWFLHLWWEWRCFSLIIFFTYLQFVGSLLKTQHSYQIRCYWAH